VSRARLPWVLLGVTVVLIVAMLALSVGHEPFWDTVIYALLALTLGTVGAFVALPAAEQPDRLALLRPRCASWRGRDLGGLRLPIVAYR